LGYIEFNKCRNTHLRTSMKTITAALPTIAVTTIATTLGIISGVIVVSV